MKNTSNNFEIVTDQEEISFGKYMDRLEELVRDCGREEYFAEILIPFLRMCCPENVKIIPVFDDRKSGRKTHNETDAIYRMKKIGALNKDGTYVVPDYIFVPNEYTFENPCKPYLMVESKYPKLIKKDHDYIYRPLEDSINKYSHELIPQIESCGAIIYTDGLTWMFLTVDKEGNIVYKENYDTIKLINTHEKYYKTNRITRKHDLVDCDLDFIGLGRFIVKTKPKEWQLLKKNISQLVCDLMI